MKLTFFALFTLCLMPSLSQKDSVLMLNGKVIHGDVIGFMPTKGDSVVKYEYTKNGDTFSAEIERYRVFSFVNNGSSRILYRQDEFSGNYLSIAETQSVTYGSYNARQTFKPHVAIWTGFALGFGASLFDTFRSEKTALEVNPLDPPPHGMLVRKPTMFPFIVPPVVTAFWAFPTFRLKDKKILHKHYKGDENFYRGYHRIAKQKRMLGGLFGSLGGVAVGLITYYTFQAFQ